MVPIEFGEEELPTKPARPAPVELAQQTWLANASRAIRGSLRTATNRWRVIAVAAVEGGAARVSEVDFEELAAPGADPDADSDADSDTDTDTDSDADSDADADTDTESDARAAPAAACVAPSLDAAPPSNRASAAHAVEIVGAVAPFEISAEPLARRDLGPRGTMRIADAQRVLENWGPKGTVKLDTRLRTSSAAARRAARTVVLPKPSRWTRWLAAGIVLGVAGALVSVVLAWRM